LRPLENLVLIDTDLNRLALGVYSRAVWKVRWELISLSVSGLVVSAVVEGLHFSVLTSLEIQI